MDCDRELGGSKKVDYLWVLKDWVGKYRDRACHRGQTYSPGPGDSAPASGPPTRQSPGILQGGGGKQKNTEMSVEISMGSAPRWQAAVFRSRRKGRKTGTSVPSCPKPVLSMSQFCVSMLTLQSQGNHPPCAMFFKIQAIYSTPHQEWITSVLGDGML